MAAQADLHRRAKKRDSRLFDDAFMSRLEYLDIVAKKAFRGQNRGERRAKKIGAGLEFADHRRYSPGDDFRNIDWNVYARMGRLLLRLYEEEEDLFVYLLVDASAQMGESRPMKPPSVSVTSTLAERLQSPAAARSVTVASTPSSSANGTSLKKTSTVGVSQPSSTAT